MALGPGVYDDLCTETREKVKAVGCIIMIIGGELGSGFSAQLPEPLAKTMPDVLRSMANQIESSLTKEG